MEKLLVIKNRIQEIYAKNANIVDKALNFLLALLTFYFINSSVGFLKIAASPFVSFGLAVICAFLPQGIIICVATILILVQMYALSLGALAVTAVVFLLMYIFYFRLAANNTLILILTVIAAFLKIPYVIPLTFGLAVGPTAVIPMAFGLIVYNLLQYAAKSGAAVSGGADKAKILDSITNFSKQILQNKEMLLLIVTFIITFLVVCTLRRMAINYAWRVAVVAGALVSIILVAVGAIVLEQKISYAGLIIGNLLGVLLAAGLEMIFFALDYTRREDLQFEDDEYVYYVKAIPKLVVEKPKKTVKTINKRQETEIIDTAEMKRQQEQGVDDKTRVLDTRK